MASSALARGIETVSDNKVSRPPTVKTTTKSPTKEELDAIELPDYGLVKSKPYSGAITPESAHTPKEAGFDINSPPKTPDELERSQPSTPKGDSTSIVPTFSFPKMNRWRVLSACLEYFGNGLNDSAPGALIPYIETWYGIGYAVVSTIWISNAVGFIIAAFVSDLICSRLGRAKALMLSELSIIIGYVVIACPVPFPVVVVAYAAVGFGEAVTIALNNV